MHVFVRHPPLPQLAGVCYGRVDATPDGGVVAEAAAALTACLPDWPIACSPSLRCRHLAESLHASRRARGVDVLPPRIDARLRELDFGAWEGLHWDAVPRAALDAWSCDVAGFAPPGGESFLQLIARVRDALGELDAPHVVITHAGVVRAARHLAGLELGRAAALDVPYLQPLAIDTRPGA